MYSSHSHHIWRTDRNEKFSVKKFAKGRNDTQFGSKNFSLRCYPIIKCG